MTHSLPAPRLPSPAGGLMLGIGLGGFVDGIVLHQILQWHHMISAVDGRAPTTLGALELNTLADGFFHLATWSLVVGGTVAVLRDWRCGRLAPSRRSQLGLVLAGWGAFDVVEGW